MAAKGIKFTIDMTEEERKDFELALKLQEDYGGEEEPY